MWSFTSGFNLLAAKIVFLKTDIQFLDYCNIFKRCFRNETVGEGPCAPGLLHFYSYLSRDRSPQWQGKKVMLYACATSVNFEILFDLRDGATRDPTCVRGLERRRSEQPKSNLRLECPTIIFRLEHSGQCAERKTNW